jgi:hypothetical protein
MASPVGNPLDMFEARYIPEPNSGCWLWIGTLNNNGYGIIGIGGRRGGNTLAHRFSLQLATGEEGAGFGACHTCDNPPCVNPDHLFWGTPADNMRDATAKGHKAKPRQTHCKHGHPLSPDNVRWAKDMRGYLYQLCLVCNHAAQRKHYYEKRRPLLIKG